MSVECGQPSCARPARRAGLCATHYKRKRLGLDLSAPIRDWRGDGQKQFWRKVDKSGDCWRWTAFVDRKGYGRHGSKLAHRVAYELVTGPIPSGQLLDHICWNHACVNPAHLRPASNSTNAQNRSGPTSRNRSGVRGVYWSAREQKWRASAVVGGWRPYLGVYDTIEEAEAVVTEWRNKHMPASLRDQSKESA